MIIFLMAIFFKFTDAMQHLDQFNCLFKIKSYSH